MFLIPFNVFHGTTGVTSHFHFFQPLQNRLRTRVSRTQLFLVTMNHIPAIFLTWGMIFHNVNSRGRDGNKDSLRR